MRGKIKREFMSGGLKQDGLIREIPSLRALTYGKIPYRHSTGTPSR